MYMYTYMYIILLAYTHAHIQQESLVEVEAHENEAEFIKNTVPFLVEHSRKAVREEIKLRAEDFSQRYDQLREFLGGYVGNLKDSILERIQFPNRGPGPVVEAGK